FFFSSRRRHTRLQGDWSSDVCSSDLIDVVVEAAQGRSEHSTDDAQRNHQQNGEGNRPAFVERGEAEENHENRNRVQRRRLRAGRSEERRVGKEGRCRGVADSAKKKR